MFLKCLNTLLMTFAFIITSFENLKVYSKDLPRAACPSLFQIRNSGENYIGKITLHCAPLSSIKIEAQFAQLGPVIASYSGHLSLFESLSKTAANLQNGKPITYRVVFPNSNEPPKLIRIRVNDRTICTESGLSKPRTTFTIQHTFYPSLKPSIANGHAPQPIQHTAMKIFKPQSSVTAAPPKMSLANLFNPTNPFLPKRPSAGNVNSHVVVTTPIMANMTPTSTSTSVPKPKFDANCGQEGSILTPFIVGGTNFVRGRFPWLTAIYVRQSADLKFICGGSLVSTRSVVTAAHCFLDTQISADHVVVFMGRHNLHATETGVEQRDIQTLIKHPEFNTSAMFDADIAVLHMSSPVSFTQFIRPICLWSSSTDPSTQFGLVAGWGGDNTGLEVTSVPKMVQVDIVCEADCLRSSDIFRTLTSSRSLCAGKRDGDSGGGLMINNDGRWTLRAIVSLGLTNNQNNRRVCDLYKYVVYSDLSKHVTWVHQNVLQ